MQNDISRQWAFLTPFVPGEMLTAQAQQVESFGMAGIFVPDRRVTWPAANPADSLYQQDLRHAMRLVGSEHDMNMHHAMSHH